MTKLIIMLSFVLFAMDDCDAPTPIGELQNCNKWVTYRVSFSDGFWRKFKTIHYPNYSEQEQRDFFMGRVGNLHKVPSDYIITIRTVTNECNATNWIVRWDPAKVRIPEGHPGVTIFRERCLVGRCDTPGNNPVF